MKMETLPDEIIIYLSRHLDYNTLKSYRLVNTLYRDILYDLYIERKIELTKFGNNHIITPNNDLYVIGNNYHKRLGLTNHVLGLINHGLYINYKFSV